MSLRILVVDDNDDHRFLTRRALRSLSETHDLEIEVAVNGEDALEKVARHPPELMLLDIKMPGKNGLEVLREIRASEASRHVVVLMFTSSEDDRDTAHARLLGADDYVTKPMDPASFRQALALALTRWVDEARRRSARADGSA